MSEPQPNPQNDIVALRTTLFDTLRALGDKNKPMDLERAQAINVTAQTIINSVKVEVDALRIIGGSGSGFIPTLPKPKTNPSEEDQSTPGKTVHRIR